MLVRRNGTTTRAGGRMIALGVALLLLAACVLPPIFVPLAAPAESPPTAAPEPATPTPEPFTPTPEPPTATPTRGTEAGGGGTIDMEAIFPPGSERERELVLFSCGSCHSWVCAVIGQRPVEHWRTTQATHRDLVSGLNDEEYSALFNFLAENFNDTKPEPDLPPALRELGCTTQ